MRFEKLTDAKIKIVLSLQDIKLNNISAENIFSNEVSSQKLLHTMLNKAKTEIGFETGDSKLLVEAIMSSSEEYVFTITKLDYISKNINTNHNSFIYNFKCFEDFVALCTFLKNLTFLCLKDISKNFSLIYYNNTYYLKYVESNDYLISIDYLKKIFNEFGEDVSNSTNIDGILNEYGKVILKNNAIIKCIDSFNTP